MKLISLFDFVKSIDINTGTIYQSAVGFDFVPDNQMPPIRDMDSHDAEDLLKNSGVNTSNWLDFVFN